MTPSAGMASHPGSGCSPAVLLISALNSWSWLSGLCGVFADFSEGNEPYGELDFGSFNLTGETLFWKIDYSDLTLT